ncbi:LamG domain-containing protein [Geofilum rubicundum]|uniref:LamG-like jellyroll fold domain-containing protein n=1 Tax=Geofilum rubicundum JCM 15548 TaxID=1236989 RepID=A0A0E9LRB5_9BACT|nr:LamG domain-containing protein [Geofilum rubicundum]GAO27686.1 hypothetical protein JCM15548_14529 [Geofilum rubicundum JCM 15548]
MLDKRRVIQLMAIVLMAFGSFIAFGQTGPAGIGNSSGTNGHPHNLVWLDASDLSGFTTGDSWLDKSGNNHNAVSSGANLTLGDINGVPALDFSAFSSGNFSIAHHVDFNDVDQLSIFVVYNSGTSTNPQGLVSKRTGSGDISFSLFQFSNYRLYADYIASGNRINGANNTSETNYIGNYIFQINDSLKIYKNGILDNGAFQLTGAASTNITTVDIEIGKLDATYSVGNNFKGKIAEIIIYKTNLTPIQRAIVVSYLSTKYGIGVQEVNLAYSATEGTYYEDLTGYARSSTGFKNFGPSDGLYISLNDADIGDYITAAHNGALNDIENIQTGADVTASGAVAAWNRDWYVEKGGLSTAKISFSFPEGFDEGSFPQELSNYVLLRKDSPEGTYSQVNLADKGVELGERVWFEVAEADFEDGYYTLGTLDQSASPLEGGSTRTWYSLISGDWDNWEVWTLDPSGALPNNPNHYTPTNSPTAASDKVVVLNGKTVTVSTNDKIHQQVTVDGRLDLQGTSGHDFGQIRGRGRILLNADHFPAGDATHFSSAGQGEGTVVYYGDGFDLTQNLVFFNLEVDLASASDRITLLNDLTINGEFRVKNGEFQFNDDVVTNDLNVTVHGHIVVETNGKLLTGTANARHQFNLYGDFTNNGNVAFTNRLTAIYNSEAADGIVDVNFLNGSKNQLAFFNGPSKMFRIEIDKGTDATYELILEATHADHFQLLGRADQGHSETAQLTSNSNALGLLRGTVRVKSNINIPVLNNTGNYNISESARLWVDGGYVAKTSGTAIVPYGVIQVSSGTLESLVQSGITTRGNGLVKVEGGTLNMNQLRTSVLGTENVGGFVQSGGTTNVMGGSTSNDYYCFNLTYPGNVFNMSGGTLHIHEANSKGGVFIASSETNYNVTGGTVILEVSDSDDFPITSIAPFWNVVLRNSSGGNGQHILSGGTDVGSSNENLSAQPLVVLNDLTIEADAFLNHDGNDVIIGRNFSINANAQSVTFDDSGMNDTWNSYNIGYLFDPAKPNTTIFNGSEDGAFYIGYNTSDGFEAFFHNITINKEQGKSITVVCDTQKSAQYQDDNNRNHWFARLLRVENELRVESGILNQGQSAFRLFGPLTVLEDGVCSVWEQGITHPWAWLMVKDADLEITTQKGAVIGNIKMNPNPTTDIITFTSDVYIKRIGYFHGRINLQSYELKLDYLIDELTTNNYDISDGNSSQEMFYSAGKASDGGLSLYVPAGSADGTLFPFPLGVLGKYTPAEIELSNVTDDGYINIRPVDGELQTTNLSGGDLLNYYWRVKYEGFDAEPTVNQLRLKYNDADIVGSEASYVAGKVLDVHPFTRSYEDDPNPEGVNPSNNTITFNGAGDTGFTLEEAFYTAGETGRFTGSPEIFYVRQNGDWNNGNTWSYSRGGGAAGDYPKAGDIAIMRRTASSYSGIITVRQPETAAAVIFDDENGFASGCPRIVFDTQNSYASYGSNFEIVDVADTHQGGTLNYNTHGAVIQYNIEDSYSNASTSLEFDGNDDYVAIQNFNYNSAGLTAFTVETWIKTNDAGDQIIASFDRNEFWRLEVNGNGAGNGQIGFDIMTDAGQLDFGGSTRIDDGNWHHVAGVFDNGNVYLYIDGNLDNSTTRGSTFGSAGVTRYGFLGVGSEADSYNGSRGPNNYFNGSISDFRVWSVARSQAQIQASMNSGLAGSETGLEIYYKLDGSGSENTLTDVTSSGNTGDLMNFSLPGAWTTYHPWGSSFPKGDFGGFNSYPNALVIYGWDGATANADVTLSASATEYPQMWFSGGNGSRKIRFPDTNVTIHGGFTIPAQAIVVANGDSDNIITMMQNFTIGSPSLGYGEFLFPGNSTNPVTLDVKKNINIRGSTNSFLGLENASGGTSIHKFIVGGDVTVDASGGQIRLGDGDPAKSNVELEFQGNENASFINNYGSSTPQFYRLIMNKGVSPTAAFSLNSNFSLTGATSGVDMNKAIELRNGNLVLNNSAINVNLTTGDDDFFIPQTAALEVRQGQVRANGNSGILLDGQLIVSGGIVDMSGGNNYIQYSASGNAAIDVSDGSLIVGSQIRRGLTSSEGILDYTQTGGTVIVGNDVAPENSRGVFEVLNTGSSFSFTGGELHIVRAQNNPTMAAVYLAPETVTTDDAAVLRIGNVNTPSNQTIGLYANVEIPNLLIDNTGGGDPVLRQWTVPLTVSNLLEVEAGAGFDADGNDLILMGDFLCAGDFMPNGNTTIFSGAGDQEITGDLTFFNLTKSSPGELRLNNSISVQNRLRHEDGLLVDNSHVVSVGGSLYMYGDHEWGGSGRGIVLNGIEQQMLYGSGVFGKLTTNNPEGIKVDDGNTVYINRALQMEQGVLNVGSNLLVLAEEALIIEENPFSASNMIQTNISFTDNGVKKFLPSGAGNFTFPVGSGGKYTPVKLSITANNSDSGSLLVKPAGEAHPSVLDVNNVLNYHWVVRADGLSGFAAEARMKYDIGDVKGNISNYITARLLSDGSGEWNKFSGEEVIDESTRELVFSFFSTDDAGISGDYTAGLDAAIPNQVPTYITTMDGLWNNAVIWDTYPTAGGSVPESGPRGSMVVVNHAVEMPVNYTSSYRTTIGENGILSIGSTFGHRLGEVFGSGVLSLESGDMPAGFYDAFLEESGGTLRFGGNTNYDILSTIHQLNNLELTGSGTRRFPNIDVQMTGDLLIDGPQARNEQNRRISVKGDVFFESGSFVAGNGETSVFVLNGSASQTYRDRPVSMDLIASTD